MVKKLIQFLSFLRFVLVRFQQDNCLEVAASLTYTALLALVPLLTIALSVIAAFPVFAEWSLALKMFILSNLVPESAGKVITVYMQQFAENAAQLTAVGIVFLAVTALMLMRTIDQSFNTIWRVTRRRPFIQRFLTYWAVLTIGPLLIGASLSLTSYFVTLSLGYVAAIPALGVFMLRITPLVLTIIAFALLYLTVPNRYVPRWHALIGGLIAGLAFELMKKIFTVYVTNFPTYKLVYGAFASFPIFLLWIYFSWLVVLLGASITAALSYWHGNIWQTKKTSGGQFYDAISILHVLYRAHQVGATVTLKQMRGEINLGLDEMEDVLEKLSSADWVRKVAGNAWILAKNPQEISVAEVYKRFVFEPGMLPFSQPHHASGQLDEMATRMGVAMDMPLANLYAEQDKPPAESVAPKVTA